MGNCGPQTKGTYVTQAYAGNGSTSPTAMTAKGKRKLCKPCMLFWAVVVVLVVVFFASRKGK